jgi:RNA polymerase sigma factor (sigma-70 family)
VTPVLSSTLLRTQSDARLAGLAARGSDRAFEAIVERYRRPLHRYCRRVLPEARAEDAVQTTFLKAWTSMREGTEVADLKPWLYRIARNAALDNARKAGYAYEELTDALRTTPGPEAEAEQRRVIRETLTGVAGLPESQREALLRTAAGHSRVDIARELDLSEGAVRQLVHRARTTLRAAATALTPAPFLSWAAALGETAGGPGAQRIAELAAGAGSAGIASAAVKVGAVVVAAGVLAAGPGQDLRQRVAKDSSATASSAQPASDGDRSEPGGRLHRGPTGVVEGRRGRGPGSGGRRGSDDSGRRGDDSGGDGSGSSESGQSGSGRSGGDDPGGDDHSGSSGSGSSGSGGGEDNSGSSGSGSSGSGGGDDGSSGSGSSGSGSSGSGGGGGDDPGSSGSGSSGSGSSGSGLSGSGSSGSGKGDSGKSDSSGSGSDDDLLPHD